jgi:hypothetical protein
MLLRAHQCTVDVGTPERAAARVAGYAPRGTVTPTKVFDGLRVVPTDESGGIEAGTLGSKGASVDSYVRKLADVAGKTLRDYFQEAPLTTTLWAASAVAAYAVVGVVRPRWLTADARHPVRRGVLLLVVRGLSVTWYEASGQSWIERNERAYTELQAQLGRDPTPEEQWARMETLKAEGS